MSVIQIVLTALATVVGGALTLAVGQIIVRGALEPALKIKAIDRDYCVGFGVLCKQV